MTALDLQSEEYQPTGSMAGRGVRRQLGRPEMDPLALLVREAGQNSWDARVPDRDTIRFGVDLRTVGSQEREILQDRVFADHPPNLPFELLDDGHLAAITIYDRGTSGLGGPTRADEPSGQDGPARDFVDFLRNVGHPPDKERGGGTYGYGKAVFYTLSQVRSICVHTRTVAGERRFMAAALGDQFSEDSRGSGAGMFTGRHWWGEKQNDGIVDPVSGPEADELARQIGMPGFPDRYETGTSITVVAPELGETSAGEPRTLRDAALFIREVLLWYLWPKMIDTSTCRMDCEIYLNDERLPLPDPGSYRPLSSFVEAMRAVKSYSEEGEQSTGRIQLREIEHGNYRHRLGIAGVVISPQSQREALTGTDAPVFTPVGESTHHIALMRSPELVVRYLPGPELPQDLLEYAGVFRADDDRDRSFAESEPPAHDDWVPESVEDRAKASNVRVALRKIREFAERVVEPHTDNLEGEKTAPLGEFARSLGSLLPTSSSGGGEEQTGNSGNSGGGGRQNGPGRKTSRVERVQEPEYDLDEDRRVVRFFFEVQHPEDATGSRVMASPLIALDDGSRVEDDPPDGTMTPEVVRWIDPEGNPREGTETIKIPNRPGTWSIVLTIPEDVSVGVELSANPIME